MPFLPPNQQRQSTEGPHNIPKLRTVPFPWGNMSSQLIHLSHRGPRPEPHLIGSAVFVWLSHDQRTNTQTTKLRVNLFSVAHLPFLYT